MPYLPRSFPQKSPVICSSFAKHDLRLKASYGSSPPCKMLHESFVYVICDMALLKFKCFDWRAGPPAVEHLHVCDMAHLYSEDHMSNESFTCVTWLHPTCSMSHSNIDMAPLILIRFDIGVFLIAVPGRL